MARSVSAGEACLSHATSGDYDKLKFSEGP
jgi:hypothetical protein